MPPVPPPKRHPYDQWAPDARALDLVGDKWTLLIAEQGGVRIEEREAPEADARVAGPERSWIEAFAPDGSSDALEVSGNRRLAETLLSALRNELPRRAVAAA